MMKRILTIVLLVATVQGKAVPDPDPKPAPQGEEKNNEKRQLVLGAGRVPNPSLIGGVDSTVYSPGFSPGFGVPGVIGSDRTTLSSPPITVIGGDGRRPDIRPFPRPFPGSGGFDSSDFPSGGVGGTFNPTLFGGTVLGTGLGGGTDYNPYLGTGQNYPIYILNPSSQGGIYPYYYNLNNLGGGRFNPYDVRYGSAYPGQVYGGVVYVPGYGNVIYGYPNTGGVGIVNPGFNVVSTNDPRLFGTIGLGSTNIDNVRPRPHGFISDVERRRERDRRGRERRED